jgi:hypothetical protein
MPRYLTTEEKERRERWFAFCGVCGDKFGWSKNGDKAKFCSRVCAGKSNGSISTVRGKLNHYVCARCSKPFSSYYKNRKYCGKDCATQSWIEEMPPSYKCRKDHNHQEIVDALTEAGASVMDASAIGKGFPDLIICIDGRVMLMEIKNPKTAYGRAGLSGTQKKFHEKYAGWPVSVVDSPEAALRHLKVLQA